MKSINDNASYRIALAQLTELIDAQTSAIAEERTLLAQLDRQNPADKPSALDRAKAMLNGGTPAPRADIAGLTTRLNECRAKMVLLNEAIDELRSATGELVSAQSAIVNADAKAGHIKAVQGIKTALTGLRDAMGAEQALRAGIDAAGYRCTIEALENPELAFSDPNSTAARFAREIDAYLLHAELSAAKSVTVRMLTPYGAELPGDVVTLAGGQAAALVRAGYAEQTQGRPSRVPRPVVAGNDGQSIATALS